MIRGWGVKSEKPEKPKLPIYQFSRLRTAEGPAVSGFAGFIRFLRIIRFTRLVSFQCTGPEKYRNWVYHFGGMLYRVSPTLKKAGFFAALWLFWAKNYRPPPRKGTNTAAFKKRKALIGKEM